MVMIISAQVTHRRRTRAQRLQKWFSLARISQPHFACCAHAARFSACSCRVYGLQRLCVRVVVWRRGRSDCVRMHQVQNGSRRKHAERFNRFSPWTYTERTNRWRENDGWCRAASKNIGLDWVRIWCGCVVTGEKNIKINRNIICVHKFIASSISHASKQIGLSV